jgi:hypothetical protein
MGGASIAATVLAGAVGGFLAALVTLFGRFFAERLRIAEENVTKERAKWRDSVRRLVLTAVTTSDQAKLAQAWVGLALRMNPAESEHRDDRELVARVRSLCDPNLADRERVKERIVALAAHILKHDWERAKWEANHWFWQDEPQQTRYLGPASWVAAPLALAERQPGQG